MDGTAELQNHFGILVMFGLACLVSLVFLLGSQALGPKKPNPSKDLPYECGKDPCEPPSGRHAVKFYLVGMLFVIFDIELIFLYPWAVVFRELGLAGLAAILVFLGLFELGFLYAWRKGAFEWK